MKPAFFFLLLLPIFATAQAPLRDDFNDGTITESPAWEGDRDRFVVRNGLLQLDDPAPEANNEVVLTLAADTDSNRLTTWECYVRLDFAPSSTNYARIFLSVREADLRRPQPAYFVQVGGASDDADAVVLFRHDGSRADTLIAGRPGGAGPAPVIARIRVQRRPGNRWELWVDYQGGTDYQLEGTAQAPADPPGRYFGLYCRYTSTRAKSFFFDDVLIDPAIADTLPPRLLSAEPLDATTLRLRFDEALDQATASRPEQYHIDGEIGAPLSAAVAAEPAQTITLTLTTPLQNLQNYTLTATGLSDRAGNRADTLRAPFTYLRIEPAEAGDVLLTEIMADPSPSQGVLPAAEYLELFNAGEKVLDLGRLTLQIGNRTRTLPDYLLLPGQFVLLTDSDDADRFTPFGPVAPMPGFPGLANSGATLQLRNADGGLLQSLSYRDDWYGDNNKAEGGWSLERRSPTAPENCRQNWSASLHPDGGTPGQLNSSSGLPLETDPPVLLRATPLSAEELLLVFNEPLDRATAAQAQRYQIDNGIGVRNAFPQDPDAQQVLLLLEQPLQAGVVYRIGVAPLLPDCLGNLAGSPSQEAAFGLSEPPMAGDLIINELLFYPQPRGERFVELYNTSQKIIDLQGMTLRNARQPGGQNTTTVTTPYLVFPGDYVVLTANPADIRSRYRVERPAAFLTAELPTLDSDQGNLTLLAGGITIDSFDYSDKLHSALLDNRRGVSLERIDPATGAQRPGNWNSAAAAVGFATPTYRNSQFLTLSDPAGRIFQLPNNRFSPDGDGFEDVLLIQYQTDQPGYLLHLRVFDGQGRLVRTLAVNESLATRGLLQWDGATDEGSRARLGIYILWFELFTPEGLVTREQRTCVLAGYLGN